MSGTTHRFNLQFPDDEIGHWAEEYGCPDEDAFLNAIYERVQVTGGYDLDDFLALCKWKTTRSQKLVVQNSAADVFALTRRARSVSSEGLKMELLTSLSGVSWPTASVLLHVGTGYRYPILDFRSLWSLGYETPRTYDLPFWLSYTGFCRELAAETGVSLRTLDRSLWAYSKANQKK